MVCKVWQEGVRDVWPSRETASQTQCGATLQFSDEGHTAAGRRSIYGDIGIDLIGGWFSGHKQHSISLIDFGIHDFPIGPTGKTKKSGNYPFCAEWSLCRVMCVYCTIIVLESNAIPAQLYTFAVSKLSQYGPVALSVHSDRVGQVIFDKVPANYNLFCSDIILVQSY